MKKSNSTFSATKIFFKLRGSSLVKKNGQFVLLIQIVHFYRGGKEKSKKNSISPQKGGKTPICSIVYIKY